MSPVQSRTPRLHVAVVSKNPETLDGLETYLQRAGVMTSSTRQLERSAQIVSGVSAVVVFPDDYEWEAVIGALTACMGSNPGALPVVVTNAPQRFDSVVWPDDTAIPLVVPKPAWGWTILDAIRAHLVEPFDRESGP